MRRYVDITDIEIPSDENDYDELVAFADAIAEQEMIQLPERKKGKWLRSGNCIFPYECYQCGDTNERATPFCPNCGADMRQRDDGR